MEQFGNVFTTIFYLIDSMIRVLSEDTDVFVLLAWWVYLEEMEGKVQVARGDTTMLGHSVCTPSVIAT